MQVCFIEYVLELAWVEVDVLFLTHSSRHIRVSKVLGSQAWQQKPVIQQIS